MTQADFVRSFIRRAMADKQQGDTFEDAIVAFVLQVADDPGSAFAGLKAAEISDKQRALLDLQTATAKVTADLGELAKS
jgi:hypothetical protein